MTRWLLDTGPFTILANTTGAEACWRPGQLSVGEAVAGECSKGDPRSPPRLLLSAQLGGRPVVEQIALPLQGQGAEMLRRHLRPSDSAATQDLGEHESIAICAHQDAELVFVSMDKGALTLALSELGRGRVAYPYECWEALHLSETLDDAQLEELVRRTEAKAQRVPRPFRLTP